MTPRPGADAEPLDGIDAQRWAVIADAADQVSSGIAEGTIDGDGIAAEMSKIRTVDIDHAVVLNSMHIPKDAGEHRDALIAMLRRIPDGWGRWIRCDAGWYPIICELDATLAELDDSYELNQVKEKYGTLRYYFETDAEGDIAEQMRAAVRAAEERAARTCELTGEPGRLRCQGGWYKTLSDAEADGWETISE